ncbi:TPA: helix-turn-helix transcriptional regulator, partial [Streptococcus suis]|nr:helix-turn-helix transcriptional regulator [Streptococcus suis]
MYEETCHVKLTLSLISNKWKVLIIYELLSGKKRYGQLKRSLDGITKKV